MLIAVMGLVLPPSTQPVLAGQARENAKALGFLCGPSGLRVYYMLGRVTSMDEPEPEASHDPEPSGYLTAHCFRLEYGCHSSPTEIRLSAARREYMSTTTYHEILSRVQRLTRAEQLRLLQELTALIRRQVTVQTPRSILELQGLGKETWKGIDVQEYVDQERALWNG